MANTKTGLGGRVGEGHVFTQPLLDEDAERCCDETEEEAREPEDIDTDISGGWLKWGGVGSDRGGRWATVKFESNRLP